jgi:predicted rRNA methylase YqxC with S4 and FtsJ domains
MLDYAAMYRKLFNSQKKAIEILQQAQVETEELYMSAPETDVRLLKPEGEDEKQ